MRMPLFFFSFLVLLESYFSAGKLCLGAKSPRREVVRSSAGADTMHPPQPHFGGHSRSTPQGMILNIQPGYHFFWGGGVNSLWLEGFAPGSSIEKGSGVDWLSQLSANRQQGCEPVSGHLSVGCSTTRPLSVPVHKGFANVCNCSLQLKKPICVFLPVWPTDCH